jgi:uncharacterized protein YydD (DUF2326 family)
MIELKSLTSPNNSKFRPLEFKKGLNIILGEKITSNKKDSINGVGKTLSIELISYMLGKKSSKINKILQETETTLNLLFTINNEMHLITRNGKNIALDEEEISYKKLLEWFNSKFLIPFSFRQIFVRFNRESYIFPTDQLANEDRFINNKINAFLLHLDYKFVSKKEYLYKKNEMLKNIIKYIKELKEETNQERKIELKEELEKIEYDLAHYEFAEEFTELQTKADKLTKEIIEIRNKIAIKQREIKLRKEIIEVNKVEEVDIKEIVRIYEEVKFFFPKTAINHLEAVQEFHKMLYENRKKEALRDIEKFKQEIKILQQQLKQKDEERAKILKLLEGKKALEEYHNLIKRKEQILEELQILEEKERELKKYEKEKVNLQIEIDTFKKELIELKEKIKSQIEKLITDFREISSLFYERAGILSIELKDDFKSKILYKIEPKIPADDSSGVGMIKIFIYDMLLYKLNPSLIGFVSHDNYLFDLVDERQIATALDYAKKNLKQYICSINDTKFKNAIKHTNFANEEDIILTLTEKEKLFGVDFE